MSAGKSHQHSLDWASGRCRRSPSGDCASLCPRRVASVIGGSAGAGVSELCTRGTHRIAAQNLLPQKLLALTRSPPCCQVSSAMANYATEVKLFGRWSFEDVEVKDISLEDYIACKPKFAQFLPHSQGRWQKKRFRKAGCPIVERLVCSMMRYGRNNGKKVMAVRIVKHAFEIIHLLTDQNPVQVLVEAVINCGPREDSTRVGGGGAVRRQACDVSPLRRVNQSIYLITTGAREASFRNIKTIAECLADEVMNAAKVRGLGLGSGSG